MLDQALPAVIALCVVAYFMFQQINKVTKKIDAEQEFVDKPKLFAAFSAVIQEKIRSIRLDIDTADKNPNPRFKLKDGVNISNALEKLSDMIRELVFFETMNGRNQNIQDTESKLFGILSEIDKFLQKDIEDGEKIADEVRDELFGEYDRLQNESKAPAQNF
ncbi:MAG: hypothetical protein ACK5LP_05330 [Campylobacteraceae bacterium]